MTVVGLHIEKASLKDIDCLITNTQKLIDKSKTLLKESCFDSNSI